MGNEPEGGRRGVFAARCKLLSLTGQVKDDLMFRSFWMVMMNPAGI
jgi:hypothetical protein